MRTLLPFHSAHDSSECDPRNPAAETIGMCPQCPKRNLPINNVTLTVITNAAQSFMAGAPFRRGGGPRRLAGRGGPSGCLVHEQHEAPGGRKRTCVVGAR